MLYFYLFLISFFLSLIFVFLAKKIGLKYGLFDRPEGDQLKIHKKPIPLTGGFAMIVIFIFLLSVSWILKVKGFLFFDTNKLLVLILGSLIGWLYGFWDDLKWKRVDGSVSQIFKIVIQIVLGIVISILFIIGKIYWQFIPNPFISLIVSFFYFLIIFNAINILDGLDGLLAGIVFVSLVGFLVVGIILSDVLGIVLSVILLGIVLGFLFYNWRPASIFMGNNGSQFLAFVMTFLPIYYTIKPYNLSFLFGSLFIVGLPLLNISFVILRRTIKGQSIFKPDRHHLYDEILNKVGSVKKAVLINYLIQIILVIFGLFLIINL